MAEELQQLLEKIQRDGVDKANAEAKAIVDRAKEEAAAATAKAEADAKAFAERANTTIKQAARDTVLSVEAAVTRMLERVLAQDVNAALADEKTLAALVADAVKAVAGEAEVSLASDRLVAALKAQLAARGTVQVTLDEALGTGFSVKLDGGRVEHAFTGDVIAAELARRLRPDLAKLVK